MTKIIFIILILLLNFSISTFVYSIGTEINKNEVPRFTAPSPESASEDFLNELRLELKEALKRNPTEKQLGEIAFLGDYYRIWDISIEANKRLIEIGTKESAIYNNLGRAYMNIGELDAAEKYLKESLKIQPDNFFAFHNLGILYNLRKDYEQSIKYLKKAIELAPQWSSIYSDLGDTYYDMKDYDKAIESYERAISLGEKEIGVYGLLGVSYFEKGNKKEALRILQKASELNPDDETIKEVLEKVKRDSEIK